MFADGFQGRGQGQHVGFRMPGSGHHIGQRGPAFGDRAGLVENQGVDTGQRFNRRGFAKQHAGFRTATAGHHDRNGCGQAQRTRTGDDQHGHRIDHGVGKPRFRPEHPPASEGQQRYRNHRRHKEQRNTIGQALQRSLRSLRLGHQRDDLRQHRFVADLGGTHDQAAGAVEGAAGDVIALGLLHRHRLAAQHRLVDIAASLQHHTIERNLLAGPHPQALAHDDLIQRNILLGTIIGNAMRNFGCQFEQATDRGRGLATRTQFQPFAEQDQGDDHPGRLEIERHMSVGIAHFRGKRRGQEKRDQAEAVGHQHAEANQGVHVGRRRHHALPAAAVVRSSQPDHEGRCEQELGPAQYRLRRFREMDSDQVRTHGNQQQRHCQQRGEQELAAHQAQFAVVLDGLRQFRLQRHAAFGATAGTLLAHFRVHRAGVDCPGHRHRFLLRLAREITTRFCNELLPASRRAEIPGFSGVLGLMFCIGRINLHAADRVGFHRR